MRAINVNSSPFPRIQVGDAIFSQSGRRLTHIEQTGKNLVFVMKNRNSVKLERSVPLKNLDKIQWSKTDEHTLLIEPSFGRTLQFWSNSDGSQIKELYQKLKKIRKE